MPGFFNATTAPTGGDSAHTGYRAQDRLRGIGKSYVPHEGSQAKLRRLKQRTRGLQPTAEQAFRLGVWLKTALGSNQDHARLVVLHHALCLSEDHDLPFRDTLDSVLDKLESEQSAAIIQEFLK